MRDEEIGRVLRALRHRRGWRQLDLSTQAGVAKAVIAELEAGRIGRHQLDALRKVTAALSATVNLEIRRHGADLARLLDADHARLGEIWKDRLEGLGWLVVAEATFNHYGDRGSIDLLAFHPGTGILLVIELKTGVFDLQGMLMGVDRKVRLARFVAEPNGWPVGYVVPVLVVADGTTSRRRIRDYSALLGRFALRGRAAAAWLRSPDRGTMPAGLLCLQKLPRARSGDRRRAGRQRIRRVATHSRSAPASPRG